MKQAGEHFPTLLRLLNNTSLVFVLGLLLGLFAPFASRAILPYVILPMVIGMTLSLMDLRLDALYRARRYLRQLLLIIFLHYGILTGLIILLSVLLVRTDKEIFAGFVAQALAPPAVIMIPLAYLMKSDVLLATISSLILYLLSLVVAPIGIRLILGSAVETSEILVVLGELILLPLLVSRFLRRVGLHNYPKEKRNAIVNVLLPTMTYSIVGSNSHVFFSEPASLVMVLLILFIRTFVIGIVVQYFTKLFRVTYEMSVLYILYSSYKNLGVSAIFALSLLGERASLPSALAFPFEIFLFVYLFRTVRSSK